MITSTKKADLLRASGVEYCRNTKDDKHSHQLLEQRAENKHKDKTAGKIPQKSRTGRTLPG